VNSNLQGPAVMHVMHVNAWNCMETDVIDSKMVMHVIISEIRNGHVMHVIHVIFFITCTTSHYFQLHALHAITWYVLVYSGFHVPYTPCQLVFLAPK